MQMLRCDVIDGWMVLQMDSCWVLFILEKVAKKVSPSKF